VDATAPLWVGPSDGIRVRVTSRTAGAPLPGDLAVSLVDPGATGDPRTSVSAGSQVTRHPAVARDATTAASTVPEPAIVTRAQWDADEDLPAPPTYGDDVKVVFVHHTGGTNDYSCADSPSIVRSIQAYHMTDPDHMWNDIGFNFLIDKCGTIFEGRAGGVDRPVVGMHTPGFDTDSTGVALLGDMDDARPTPQALHALARLAAWKLGLGGHSPSGTAILTATASNGEYDTGDQVTVPTIAAHSDVAFTTCPGQNLTAALGTVRAYASRPSAAAAQPTADVDHNGVNDLVAGTPDASVGSLTQAGSVTLLPGGSSGPITASAQVITQNSPGVPGSSEQGDRFGAASAYGDVNGDGYADLVVGTPGEDDTAGHTDNGYVTVLYGPGLDSGAGYNLSGADLVSGAQFGAAVATGDFNGDGKADVLAIAPGAPATWWVRDSATGTVRSGHLPTSSAAAVGYAATATGDFDGDGYSDAVVTYIDPDGVGSVVVFRGSSSGLAEQGTLSTEGGRSVAVGDVNGDGYDDVVVGQPYTAESGAHSGGQVTVLYGSSTGVSTSGATVLQQDSPGVPGTAEAGDAMGASVSVGDYNLDGYADVLTGVPHEDITRSGTNEADAGATLLLPGSATGLTGAGSQSINEDTDGVSGATETGDDFGSAVSLTDLHGTSRADLAIGASGENDGDGTVVKIDTDASGVLPSTAVYYGPTVMGTPAGSHIGVTLTP
jgi:hypothetical protein